MDVPDFAPRERPALHFWDSRRCAVLLARLEQIERRQAFIYDMLTRHGGRIDFSLVGVPGADPFLEPPAGRELDELAQPARDTEEARVATLRRRGKASPADADKTQ